MINSGHQAFNFGLYVFEWILMAAGFCLQSTAWLADVWHGWSGYHTNRIIDRQFAGNPGGYNESGGEPAIGLAFHIHHYFDLDFML